MQQTDSSPANGIKLGFSSDDVMNAGEAIMFLRADDEENTASASATTTNILQAEAAVKDEASSTSVSVRI